MSDQTSPSSISTPAINPPAITAPAMTKHPLLWGAYLACSWTWCIGMFFPSLLLRDFGWPGFMIFAIPNVIGAAAMGWMLTSKKASTHMVEKNPRAVWWFSAITIAFHVFWIIWVSNFIRDAFPLPQNYLIAIGAVGISFSLVSSRAIRLGRSTQLALVLILFSIGVLITVLATPHVQASRDALLDAPRTASGVYWMLPVCIFGFLLCPYLDVTFHHARQQLVTKRGGRLGFTIGFVGMFSLMIILTTQYAGLLISGLHELYFVTISAYWLSTLILCHILCQWIFTVRVHLDQMRTIPGQHPPQQAIFPIALLAGVGGLLASELPKYSGLDAGELIYRTFLSAYGLLFPTYVLYRIVLGRNGSKPVPMLWYWIAILVATPLYWYGFMERNTVWLVPGAGLLLLIAVIHMLISRNSKSETAPISAS